MNESSQHDMKQSHNLNAHVRAVCGLLQMSFCSSNWSAVCACEAALLTEFSAIAAASWPKRRRTYTPRDGVSIHVVSLRKASCQVCKRPLGREQV